MAERGVFEAVRTDILVLRCKAHPSGNRRLGTEPGRFFCHLKSRHNPIPFREIASKDMNPAKVRSLKSVVAAFQRDPSERPSEDSSITSSRKYTLGSDDDHSVDRGPLTRVTLFGSDAFSHTKLSPPPSREAIAFSALFEISTVSLPQSVPVPA
jgi:hypothetical protein